MQGSTVILTREVARASSRADEEVLEDMGRKVDLYIFNQDVVVV